MVNTADVLLGTETPPDCEASRAGLVYSRFHTYGKADPTHVSHVIFPNGFIKLPAQFSRIPRFRMMKSHWSILLSVTHHPYVGTSRPIVFAKYENSACPHVVRAFLPMIGLLSLLHIFQFFFAVRVKITWRGTENGRGVD